MCPLLTMKNTIISKTQTSKHLGLRISSSCTLVDHIGSILRANMDKVEPYARTKVQSKHKIIGTNTGPLQKFYTCAIFAKVFTYPIMMKERLSKLFIIKNIAITYILSMCGYI